MTRARGRVEFFVGTGGAGKTTLACAAGLSYARAGRRVLLIGVDQRNAVADVFDCPTVAPGRAVAVDPGLEVLAIDSHELLEQRFREWTALAALSAGPTRLPAVDPAELIGLPGVQELSVLAEIRTLLERESWDTVIVDYGRMIDPIRSLTCPETVLGYLERMWPRAQRIMAGNSREPRRAVFAGAAEHIAAEIEGIRQVFSDPRRSGAILVTSARRSAAGDAAAIRSALALYGVPLLAVTVNKVLPQRISWFRAAVGRSMRLGRSPEDPAALWYRQRRVEQLQAVAALEKAMAPVPVRVLVRADAEPLGVAALYRLGFHPVPASRVRHRIERNPSSSVGLESGDGGLESVYALRMPLPAADPSTLRLGRVGDDIIIGVDGMRRRMKLASVLRRCAVAEAEFDGEAVIVRFRPDPEVWPV